VTNAGTLALSAIGANVITAATNGVERLRIDSSGNVGIGAGSPAGKLDVVGALRLTNTSNSANFGTLSDGGGLVITSGNNNPMYFNAGGSERLRITSAGLVGIGTNSPAATLDVAGTGAIKVPVGTEAQRPTPATGQLRFNSTISKFESYNGTLWGEFLSNVTASNFPAGTVIQVVQNATSVGTVTTTSTSYVDLTNATATITPRATSSRILVLWTSQASNLLVTGANVQYFHTILRDATGLSETWIAAESGAGGLQAKGSQAMSVLDNPSTTSAVTYKIQHRTSNASSTGTAAGGFLTLLEIAG
jgi:hypothetical protein